jgi:hypothetical protein
LTALKRATQQLLCKVLTNEEGEKRIINSMAGIVVVIGTATRVVPVVVLDTATLQLLCAYPVLVDVVADVHPLDNYQEHTTSIDLMMGCWSAVGDDGVPMVAIDCSVRTLSHDFIHESATCIRLDKSRTTASEMVLMVFGVRVGPLDGPSTPLVPGETAFKLPPTGLSLSTRCSVQSTSTRSQGILLKPTDNASSLQSQLMLLQTEALCQLLVAQKQPPSPPLPPRTGLRRRRRVGLSNS